jgi:aryl-alcohol dehydrogenase-like predicted oxidoreductase
MQYRTLGQTGVQVSSLGLGAMNFSEIGRTSQDEATAIVDAALAAGINLIDTADMYGRGESEEMVGKAIAGRRDDIVLATKASLPMGDGRNQRGGSRRWLFTALDNSLRRLGVDHVDLYQIHRWDPDTSDEETLSALTDLQRTGKIRYFGSSTFPAYRIVQAQWAARDNHLSRYVTEQPSYSILQRGSEAHVLPVTEQYGLGRQGNHHQPLGGCAGTLRHRHPGQSGTAGCRRTAGRCGRRGRPDHDPARARIRDRAPGGDHRAHRSPDAGAPALADRGG